MSNNYNNPQEEENFSFDKNKNNPFGMPEDYFNAFTNKISNRIDAAKELQEFPLLSAIPKQSSFIVSENYFLENENALYKQYELHAHPSLYSIAKPELKPVTTDYFNISKNKILQAIEIAEELKQYITLYSIDKQNNFIVVPKYFDTVAERVKEAYHSNKKERIFRFEQFLSYILKPKVVFAYSLLISIGVASFIHLNQSDVTEPDDCKTLACLERRELLNENNVNKFSDDDLYEMIDVDQLDKQLSGQYEKLTDTAKQHNKN